MNRSGMNPVKALWAFRWHLPASPWGAVFWLTWSVLSAVLVATAPLHLYDGRPLWSIPVAGAGQALLASAAFLVGAVYVGAAGSRAAGVHAVSALAAAVACYAAAYFVLTHSHPDWASWETEFALAAGTGFVLAFLPLFVAPLRGVIGLGMLGLTLAFILLSSVWPAGSGGPTTFFQATELRRVELAKYASLIVPRMRWGGAIESVGDSFILMTGDGDFYALEWQDRRLTSRELDLSLPLDPDPLLRDQGGLSGAEAFELRATDMILDRRVSPTRVYVSYQHWDSAQRCLTLRVSTAPLDDAQGSNPGQRWQTVFVSRPCLTLEGGFQILESGGRMAWLGDRLLVTTGVNGLGFPNQAAYSQGTENTHGKVLLLDGVGGYEVFTTGHRNPQGLLVGADGRIWLTEHGQRGGDELNLLTRAANYGYPHATYGTDYGEDYWPLAPNARDHGAYTEPVFAFLPSIGPGNLIQIHPGQFPEWEGDLMMGSLKGQSLFRFRMHQDRVIYVERINIGERIRDLTQNASGVLALLCDSGAIMTIHAAAGALNGEEVYGRCEACHAQGPQRVAPSLRGIVGAPVARDAEYAYSAALRGLGGVWTRERLDAFLQDPNGFAPGSRMEPGRVADARARGALLEFLETLR